MQDSKRWSVVVISEYALTANCSMSLRYTAQCSNIESSYYVSYILRINASLLSTGETQQQAHSRARNAALQLTQSNDIGVTLKT
jgi:hypothetical protein